MTAYTDTIARIMNSDFAGLSEDERVETVEEIKTVCSVAAAAAAFQPVPVVDLLIISPIQIGMVQAIGRVHGHKLDTRSVLEMLSTFGTSVLARSAISTVAKVVPYAGWALAASVSYAMTYATGEVADYYFRCGRGASPSELRAKFKDAYKRKKKEKRGQNGHSSKLKDKLDQLHEAFEAGQIDEDQLTSMKEKVLSDF